MNAFLRSLIAGLLAVSLTAPAAAAPERPAFTQEELDQMLAPVALYPDSLLSQVLMAATYPLEVVQAARWSRANPQLKGQDAVRAVESMDWDASVKSLVAFPQILQRMDEQLEWTQRLGEAFLAQETQVMDSIQGLRQRAEGAGNLRSNEQMRVTRQDGNILIEPAQQQVVYVPYYDPAVVYGGWWWPAYPPYYWGPPPGYYAWPAYAPGWYWGPAIAFSWGFFFGHADWHHHHVTVVQNHPHGTVHGAPVAKPVKWQHDPVHRRNVPYRYTNWRQPSGQHPAVRGDERSRPVFRSDPRSTHFDTRSAAPPARTQPSGPNPRTDHSGRLAPQSGERWAGWGRAGNERPQTRSPDPRPAPPVSRAAPVTRPAAPAPIARVEARPSIPQGAGRAAPWPSTGPVHRRDLPAPARPSNMIPRAAAGSPGFLPRMESPTPNGAARAYGGGHWPAMSTGRVGGRS